MFLFALYYVEIALVLAVFVCVDIKDNKRTQNKT